ncbi:MAG: YdiU family protein, partial [Gammaproteobacteria bacterium]|nr:YdiU family protein [Gammaproteobacteria bacterium]
MQAIHSTLEALRFDNRFVGALPADPQEINAVRQVGNACYSRVSPRPAPAPCLVAYAREVAELVGLGPEQCTTDEFLQVFAGNRMLPGMDPHATCYGGHQFGNWAGQLGDGRAINLGEVVNGRGEHWTLQLKGAGLTPYSRTADGLAVLRSSVREFLCSEAMHHLGVPTTRALSLVLTGDEVVRDILYDGHPAPEPGAVVCRVAPSFTRFGHFQMLAARGEKELLRKFTDFTIESDFPALAQRPPGAERYIELFREVCRLTVDMVVHWMRVGFVHGVMNTDNMSILGLTIDYGPYGWLEDYDPDWTPNTTDAANRRYRFGHQPAVAQWNLLQLANAIYPIVGQAEPLEAALRDFAADYQTGHHAMMARKLGLAAFEPAAAQPLLGELETVLRLTETDMTIFFRGLADVDLASTGKSAMSALAGCWYRPDEVDGDRAAQIEAWLDSYIGRARRENPDPDARRAA